MATLQQILGAKNLLGVIESVKAGLPTDILPPGFFTVTRPVEGAYGTYRKIVGERRTARGTPYGAASRKRELKGANETPVKLAHFFENIDFKPDLLMNLLALDNDVKQRMAAQEVARQVGSFLQMFQNTRIAAVNSIVANGKIWLDANGDILASATGAAITIDFGVPSTNTGQLTPTTAEFGPGHPIIKTSWATASTDISWQLKALKRTARQLTGYALKHAFYGANILSYILANTTLATYLRHNAGYTDYIKANNEIPDGFLGFTWHPVDAAFYGKDPSTPNAGDKINTDVPTTQFDADSVTFTPEPSADWYEMLEGTYPIPQSLRQYTDAQEAAADLKAAQGMFSYCRMSHDPVTITMYAGDTMLPLIKVPEAVFIAKVKY
jgi:hypothetical protein